MLLIYLLSLLCVYKQLNIRKNNYKRNNTLYISIFVIITLIIFNIIKYVTINTISEIKINYIININYAENIMNLNSHILILIFSLFYFIYMSYILSNVSIKTSFHMNWLIIANIFFGINLIYFNNWILFFIILEIHSYLIYCVTNYGATNNNNDYSIIYFIIGSFASIIILVSIVLTLTENDENTIWTLILLIFGITIKLGLIPFHSWLINVYENINTYYTLWINILPKIVLLQVLLIIFNYYDIYNTSMKSMILIYSLISLLIGSILGLTQIKIKRLIAYSGIINIIYLIIAIMIGGGYNVYNLYLIQYILNLALWFTIIINKNEITGQSLQNMRNYFVNYVGNNVLILILLLIVVSSLIGLPPTLGFLAKYSLFSGIFDNILYNPNNSMILTIIFIFIVVSTVFTLIFYITNIKQVLMNNEVSYVGYNNTIYIDKLISPLNMNHHKNMKNKNITNTEIRNGDSYYNNNLTYNILQGAIIMIIAIIIYIPAELIC